MNEAPRKTTVTLEDLLRLKRAEQPPPKFWTQFEQGMRTKQLAAIVEPRPWWAPFIRIGTRLSRYQLPVGATAILAITLFTVREYHPVSPTPTFEPATAETATLTTPAPADEKTSANDSASAPAAASTTIAAVASAPTPVSAMPVAAQDQVVPAVPIGAASHVAMVNPEFSSARYMADRLATAHAAADPELDRMLGQPARNVELNPARDEPLAQISVPGESRTSRLLGGIAMMASIGTGDSALRVNEQAARRLTERRLSESDVTSRLDVGGNRVTVKF